MTRLSRPTAWLTLSLALLALALFAFTRRPGALQALGLRPSARPLAVVKANPDVRRVASADTDFGFRLLARLAPDKSHPNVFFSPFSISQALSLTWNGAGGVTQKDIGATLGLSGLTASSVNAANGLLLPSLEDPDPQVKLSVANALWLQTGETFRPAFRQDAKRFYRADTTTLNLRGPQGAPTINGWVSKHTQGKIDQIVTPSDLSSATAVLTDAVYFHGEWTTPFDKAETHNAPFRLGNGRRKMVALMSQEGEFSYLASAAVSGGPLALWGRSPGDVRVPAQVQDRLRRLSWDSLAPAVEEVDREDANDRPDTLPAPVPCRRRLEFECPTLSDGHGLLFRQSGRFFADGVVRRLYQQGGS